MKFDLDLTTQVLARTPTTLQTLLGDLPEPWTLATEGLDTFSPYEVVGHLIGGDETDWIARAKVILAQKPGAQFEPFDRFRHRTRNVGRTMASLLAEFGNLRASNLELLRSWKLTAEMLELGALHPTFGRVTLQQLLATWLVHDLGHLAQVSRVMAKQYRDAVGPWIRFLPVLTDHETPRT